MFVKKYLKRNVKKTEIDESSSQSLYDTFDMKILLSSLRSGQFYEKEQLKPLNYTEKHISALCGACVRRIGGRSGAENSAVNAANPSSSTWYVCIVSMLVDLL